ncbi:MAG: HipA N-terminal domain-containing protein [Bacteroidia bacterium]|nr:HipA N-terminal domain-containing protein [Bacteroidia bacterium]
MMFKNIFYRFLKNEEQEDLYIPESSDTFFALFYKDLIIGKLSVKNGVWEFRYSESFKNQDIVQKIIDFPDTEKIYISDKLWPFFAHRIPGLAQPSVKKIIEEENIDHDNEVDLLKRFGHKSIANPFELTPELG